LTTFRIEKWSQSNDWVIRIAYKDSAFGDQGCDVLFIPKNIAWLIKKYDQLLWKPKWEELFTLKI